MTIFARFRGWLAIASLGLLIVFAGIANAVVQNVTIVTDTGQPVANTTVTIVFPDGTEQEADDAEEISPQLAEATNVLVDLIAANQSAQSTAKNRNARTQ